MHQKTVAIFFTLTLVITASMGQPNMVTFHDGKFIVEWKLDASQKITFTVTVTDATGWIAIGFSKKNQSMAEADMVIGEVDGGGLKIGDYWSTAVVKPKKDTKQDLTDSSSSITGKTTLMKFARKLDTGDPNGQDISLVGDGIFILWALGNRPELSAHAFEASGRGYSDQTYKFDVVADGGTGNESVSSSPPTGNKTTSEEQTGSGSVPLTYFTFPVVVIPTLVINMF